MPGIASAATSVVIGHVAGGTTTIRVGAGGIMLPNHSPLVDRGAVRHARGAVSRPHRSRPGPRAGHRRPHGPRAGRSTLVDEAETLPAGCSGVDRVRFEEPAVRCRRCPAPACVPIWILGSSLFGAQLAAALGLPYAFASHFAPGQMMPAIGVTRASSGRPTSSNGRTQCSVQRLRRRRPTTRRSCCSPRSSRRSSTCGAAGPAACRRRSTTSRTTDAGRAR